MGVGRGTEAEGGWSLGGGERRGVSPRRRSRWVSACDESNGYLGLVMFGGEGRGAWSVVERGRDRGLLVWGGEVPGSSCAEGPKPLWEDPARVSTPQSTGTLVLGFEGGTARQ
jgi:hypothetical protein